MKIIVSIGGNALLKRGQALEIKTQRENIQAACHSLAMLAQHHDIVITHGNGPQIGLLALQVAACSETSPFPLDVLGAETQGMIGYLLSQALKNKLPQKKVITVLTQIEVSDHDPAFITPTKFIGPIYSKEDIEQLKKKYLWQFSQDGQSWRRVVPSPMPKKIIELETIESLIKTQHLVICAGGGGIPIIKTTEGRYEGVEAVIDKDFSSALLAQELHADALLLLTDVSNVMLHWGEPNAQALREISWKELEKLTFPAGSMGPKVTAACQFVKNTGCPAYIGSLTEAKEILEQRVGTQII